MMTWNSIQFSLPSSDLMLMIVFLHDFIFVSLFCILFLVVFNIYFSFHYKVFNLNFIENHFLEFLWTVVPFFILGFMIWSSISTLYYSDSCFFCGVTVFVSGHQWYWSYSLKDLENFYFDSYMVKSFLRSLDVDNRLILPFNTPIRLMVSSSDVIHSWTIPSLGVKMDCIPGRVSQSCFSFLRCGIFFGQCSEICGINHSFMPISVEVLSFSNFFNFFWSSILFKDRNF